MSNYKCQRCKRKIQYKTWKKYQGYSRQCLKKIETPKKVKILDPKKSNMDLDLEIISRLIQVLPQESKLEYHLGVMTETIFLQEIKV